MVRDKDKCQHKWQKQKNPQREKLQWLRASLLRSVLFPLIFGPKFQSCGTGILSFFGGDGQLYGHSTGSQRNENRLLWDKHFFLTTRTINPLATVNIIASNVLGTMGAAKFDLAHEEGSEGFSAATSRGFRGYNPM